MTPPRPEALNEKKRRQTEIRTVGALAQPAKEKAALLG